MARGGRRQGQPGRSYQNRTDLNVDRAVQPGSSAAPPPVPQEQVPPQQQQQQQLLPDVIPNLDMPTMYPDRPVTAGLSVGPGPGPTDDTYRVDSTYNILRAAVRRSPSNPDLRRIAAYLAAKGGNDG